MVEVAIPSDGGPRGAIDLSQKMAAYQANGGQMGWLLFPEQQSMAI